MRRLLAGLIIGLALQSVGCGDESDPVPPAGPTEGVQGQAGLCADLGLLERSLTKVKDLTPASTLTDAERARDEVQFALAELQEAETSVPTNLTAMLQSSFQAFDANLDSLASGSNPPSTLGDQAAALKARASGMFEAEARIKSVAGCPN